MNEYIYIYTYIDSRTEQIRLETCQLESMEGGVQTNRNVFVSHEMNIMIRIERMCEEEKLVWQSIVFAMITSGGSIRFSEA